MKALLALSITINLEIYFFSNVQKIVTIIFKSRLYKFTLQNAPSNSIVYDEEHSQMLLYSRLRLIAEFAENQFWTIHNKK